MKVTKETLKVQNSLFSKIEKFINTKEYLESKAEEKEWNRENNNVSEGEEINLRVLGEQSESEEGEHSKFEEAAHNLRTDFAEYQKERNLTMF